MQRSVDERIRDWGSDRLFFSPKNIIEKMRDELGLSQYYELYRLAAALSLSDYSHKEQLPTDSFSERQEVWLRLVDRKEDDYLFYRLFCRLENRVLTSSEFKEKLVGAIEGGLSHLYYVFGIGRGEYQEKDYRIIEKMLSAVGSSRFGINTVSTSKADTITVKLGSIRDEVKEVEINNRHTVPALNMAITGTSGSGKTYFALNMMSQLLSKSPGTRCFIIDPKGDITNKYGELLSKHGFAFYHISFEETRGREVASSLPINPFMFGSSSNAITERLLAVFREAVFQNNPVQQSDFREAVSTLLENANPEVLSIQELADVYLEQRKGKADKVSNFLNSLVSNQVFAPDGMPPKEFFEQNAVVSYAPDLNADIQGLVTNLLVTLFRDAHQDLSEGDPSSEYRHLHRLLFIDEAHNLSNMKSTGLKRLLREGRSFGLGLMLASQHVNHFGQLIKGMDLREEIPMWFILNQTLNQKTHRMLEDIFSITPREQGKFQTLVTKLTNAQGSDYLAITNVADLHTEAAPIKLPPMN